MKFIANPAKIKGIDDLYDLLELNKANPTKYLFIRNDGYRGGSQILQSSLTP